MTNQEKPVRRRDVLRASAGAGLLGFTGFTVGGATAQEETTTQDGATAGAFSFSLEEGDYFRARYRVSTPFGESATETIPAGCLDGESSEEYPILAVRAFRGESDLGYRGLMVPERVIELGQQGTETETTTAETTTADTAVPTIENGMWYQVTSSEQCDGLFALTVETMEAPETTPGGGETTTEE